ncbi:hypothetical protein GCM10027026_39770 [Myroides odoratimimus subsp. xuanwuensis]
MPSPALHIARAVVALTFLALLAGALAQAAVARPSTSAAEMAPALLKPARQSGALTLPRTSPPRAAISASARFTPKARGRKVLLQRRNGKRWVKVVAARQTRRGTASFRFTAPVSGTHRYRALATRRGALKPLATRAKRLTIRTSWVQLDASADHTCGVKSDGAAWCWGRNADRELGVGDTNDRSRAARVQVGSDWRRIDVGDGRITGENYTCGLRGTGSLWCFGSHATGQLGRTQGAGDLFAGFAPGRVGNATDWTDVSAGGGATCGIRHPGTLWCWGSYEFGQIGTGQSSPVAPSLDFASSPQRVGAGSTWKQVSVGKSHTCAVRTSGTLWCWGRNFYGELGLGDRSPRASPVQVGSGTSWAQVAAGMSHTCAVRTEGTAWCWGSDDYRQLGDGDAAQERLTPNQVGTAGTWTAISVSQSHTCARQADGSLWCWGWRGFGQLGDGVQAFDFVGTPRQLSGGWRAVTSGGDHSCAIHDDDRALCWGKNLFGQLGDGTDEDRSRPTRVR